MPQVNLETATAAIETLSEEDFPQPAEIPFELVLRPNNKTSRLLTNSGQIKQIDGHNRWYDFEFSEGVFLTDIEIFIAEYASHHQFSIRYRDSSDAEVSIEKRVGQGTVKHSVNSFIKSISFKPPKAWLYDTKINSVKLLGLTQADIPDFLSTIERIEDYRAEAVTTAESAVANAQKENARYVELQAQLVSLNNESDKTRSEISARKSEVTKLSAKIESLKTDLSNSEIGMKVASESKNRIENEISTKTEIRNNLSDNIAKETIELKILKDNINLFPSEISGFVKQGTQTMYIYIGLVAVPVIIILAMFVLLVRGAADLTTVLTENPTASVYAIFLTRLPYVTIAGMIIAASYKICRVFMTEVIRINQQKLNLTKISIIAKDVSFSSEVGLDMSDEEIYQFRTKLKMELLRDHLKDYISKDFKVGLPESINGISSAFSGFGKTDPNDGSPQSESPKS